MQPKRPAQTTLAFHASRIVIDTGVLIAMASMSMSFVLADSGDRSALDADALPAILMLLPVFAITLIPNHTRPLHPIAAWAALVLGLGALPYAVVKMLDAGVLADTLDGSVGLGARLLVVGSLVTLIGIGIGLYRNIRGLPAGGTPQRTSTLRPRSKPHDGRGASSLSDRKQARSAAEADPASDEMPTRLLPAASESEATPEAETESRSSQPEIVFPDTGAVTRQADPAQEPESPLLDTAERADAAIDDHLMSMFDQVDDPDSPEST